MRNVQNTFSAARLIGDTMPACLDVVRKTFKPFVVSDSQTYELQWCYESGDVATSLGIFGPLLNGCRANSRGELDLQRARRRAESIGSHACSSHNVLT